MGLFQKPDPYVVGAYVRKQKDDTGASSLYRIAERDGDSAWLEDADTEYQHSVPVADLRKKPWHLVRAAGPVND